MTHYTMCAGSQGALYIQRATAELTEKDVHSMDPEVEFAVRKWLSRRLNGFYCDLQAAYMHHRSPTARAGSDEIIPVGLQGLNFRDAVERGTI